MDVRVNGRGQVRVGHSSVSKNSPLFEAWFARLVSLSKTGMAKVDIKEPEAVEPLIKAIQKLDKTGALLKDRTMVFNADIPLGSAHRGSAIRVSDLKKLRDAFPSAVISLGVDAATDQVDDALLKDIDQALDQLGGINTIAFHYTTQLPAGLFEHLEARNSFVTVWANRGARNCISNAMLARRIPKEYRDKVWLDFPNP
jgi:hypothetical protein